MRRYIAFMWYQYDAAGGWGDKVEGSYDSIEAAVEAIKAADHYSAGSIWHVVDLNDGRVVMDDLGTEYGK